MVVFAEVEITPWRVVGAVVNLTVGLAPPPPSVPPPTLSKYTRALVLPRASDAKFTVVAADAGAGWLRGRKVPPAPAEKAPETLKVEPAALPRNASPLPPPFGAMTVVAAARAS